MRTADAIVVGGGVVGSAVAWFLAREGVSVALLERDEIAVHASGAAAGMLRPMGESSGIGTFLDFGLASHALFPDLVSELRERTGLDPEYAECGVLEIATAEDEARQLEAKARELAHEGVEWIDDRAARSEAPVAPETLGALWSPREGRVRSPLLSRAFVTDARALGATVETGVSVLGLRRDGATVTGVATTAGDWSAPRVILCMGAWTPSVSSWLDVSWRLPVEPVRGQILSLDAPDALRCTVIGGGTYLVPRADGSVVVGATSERVGFDCRVTASGLSELLEAAPRVVPGLANATFQSAWAGLRPATPDGLPAIGPVPGTEGLLVAAGHYRNGVLLSPITGRLVADLVLGKAPPAGAAALLPERFL